MYKKIIKSAISLAVLVFLLDACRPDSENPFTFTTSISLLGSSIEGDQSSTQLMFSTDNGVTYQTFPTLTVGKQYVVKVVDNTTGKTIKDKDYFTLDYSQSSPKPTFAADSAVFVVAGANAVIVKITDKHCTYDAASWTGAWGGDEVGACCGGTDANTITADPTTTNRFIMNNFWGDGVDAYFDLTPSTTAHDQTLVMPQQTTSENGVATGTGTYDQCRGTFTIATTYKLGATTYAWQYNFHR